MSLQKESESNDGKVRMVNVEKAKVFSETVAKVKKILDDNGYGYKLRTVKVYPHNNSYSIEFDVEELHVSPVVFTLFQAVVSEASGFSFRQIIGDLIRCRFDFQDIFVELT